MQLRSFEETLALVGAMAVAGIVYKLFSATALTSAITGLIAAVGIAYLTSFEFLLQDDAVTIRSRFHERSMPIEWIQKASMKTFWGGLPGRTHMFLLRHPPAPWGGYFQRTGLITWPSAERWIAAVNEAAQKSNPSK
jgi:hypothetical protein